MVNGWRNDIVRWRCGLKASEVARLRGRRGCWNCRDLKITVTRIGFDQLDPTRAKRLGKVKTSWTLPVNEVDDLISAGGDALKDNAAFQRFLKEI
jgi:NTE family protein